MTHKKYSKLREQLMNKPNSVDLSCQAKNKVNVEIEYYEIARQKMSSCKCKYCGEEKEVYVDDGTSYCYKCNKYTFTFIGKVKSICWLVCFYFKILFCFWHPVFKDFWSYLLEERKDKNISWPRVIWCRWRGHLCGPIWYSNRDEPNMTCKNCGDDLG